MPTYVVTGVSRGIGWAFLNELSSNPDNTVIGLVRNKLATDERVKKELDGRSNITIVPADITEYASLKKAAAEVSKITGGSVDVLISNAALVSNYDAFDGLHTLGADPDELTEQFRTAMDTNVLSNIHLINLFMPQILKGQAKKVTIISSGMADTDLVNEYEVHLAPVYTMTKAAVNMVTAKFNAIYKKDGVLFLSISPGLVDVGSYGEMAPEKVEALGSMLAKFKTYSPDFAGPSQPEDAAKSVLSVIETSSLAQGHGGAFLSHFGNKQWI